MRVEKAINIPLTYGGRAEFMIQNVLAATLACFVHGVSLEDIRVGLTTFHAVSRANAGTLEFYRDGRFHRFDGFRAQSGGFNGLEKFHHKLLTRQKPEF